MEYKGVVPPNELQNKQREIEIEVNSLIPNGGKVSINLVMPGDFSYVAVACILFINLIPHFFQVYATVLPYEEAAELCGGSLPDYIPQVRMR